MSRPENAVWRSASSPPVSVTLHFGNAETIENVLEKVSPLPLWKVYLARPSQKEEPESQSVTEEAEENCQWMDVLQTGERETQSVNYSRFWHISRNKRDDRHRHYSTVMFYADPTRHFTKTNCSFLWGQEKKEFRHCRQKLKAQKLQRGKYKNHNVPYLRKKLFSWINEILCQASAPKPDGAAWGFEHERIFFSHHLRKNGSRNETICRVGQ